VCIDCADAAELAEFYRRLLGWEITARDGEGWLQLGDPSGAMALNIQAEEWYRPPTWPEQPDAQHKMLHFEIEVDDLDTAVSAAVEAGGRPAPWQPPDRDQSRIRVMLDPAGHPFCLFVSGE
jgi:predicted enzyme related to lactoylglutathione lyase